MFNRQSKKFTSRVQDLQNSISSMGKDLFKLNGEIKLHSDSLMVQADDASGRKESRIVQEIDDCDDLLDTIDDLSSALGVNLNPVVPVELSPGNEL
jgi:hypothetical protein